MRLYDELYFEITSIGEENNLDRLETFLRSGELEDFFEINEEYINRDKGENGRDEIIFTNDELATEISSLDVEDFLDVFCKAARALDVRGTLYDGDDNEFSFTSPMGKSEYFDVNAPCYFNDELDEAAREEEGNADEEDEE